MPILTLEKIMKAKLLLLARAMYPDASTLVEALSSCIEAIEEILRTRGESLPVKDAVGLRDDLNLFIELRQEAINKSVQFEAATNTIHNILTIQKYQEN